MNRDWFFIKVWNMTGQLMISQKRWKLTLKTGKITKSTICGGGHILIKNRQYDPAVNDFTKALETCPATDKETKFLILEARGDSYHALNKNDAAIKDFSEALALNPKHENIKYVYTNRGWVWQNKADYQKASQDFYAALAMDSAFAPAYYGRAHSWDKLGNLERALEDAKEALRLEPASKKYEDLVFELRAKMKK